MVWDHNESMREGMIFGDDANDWANLGCHGSGLV